MKDAEVAPHVAGRRLYSTVEYLTNCSTPSDFSVRFVGEEKIEEENLNFDVLALVRAEDSCANRLSSPVTRLETVSVELPEKAVSLANDDSAMLFLAFPPDGEFEMYKLDAVKAPPIDEESGAESDLGVGGAIVQDALVFGDAS